MKNIFLVLLAFIVTACSANQVASTPIATVTPIPPTETSTVTPAPTPIALKPGKSDSLSPDQQAFLDSNQGQSLQDWLSQWVGYWSTAQELQRVIFPETSGGETARVYFTVMTDPKGPRSMTVVLESPDHPGIIILPPAIARENMSPPPTSAPNHDVPTGDEPLMLSTTSGDDLAKLGIPAG